MSDPEPDAKPRSGVLVPGYLPRDLTPAMMREIRDSELIFSAQLDLECYASARDAMRDGVFPQGMLLGWFSFWMFFQLWCWAALAACFTGLLVGWMIGTVALLVGLFIGILRWDLKRRTWLAAAYVDDAMLQWMTSHHLLRFTDAQGHSVPFMWRIAPEFATRVRRRYSRLASKPWGVFLRVFAFVFSVSKVAMGACYAWVSTTEIGCLGSVLGIPVGGILCISGLFQLRRLLWVPAWQRLGSLT